MKKNLRKHIVVCGLASILCTLGVIPAVAADTPLINAIKAGDKDIAVQLSRKKAAAHEIENDGTTALHWAVYTDDIVLTQALIKHGADVNAKNRYGAMPISFAAENGNPKIIDALLKAGANPNATLEGGETALMTAAKTGNAQVIERLVAAGADVNAFEPVKHQTALMWAASRNNAAAVSALVRLGADVNAVTLNRKLTGDRQFGGGGGRRARGEGAINAANPELSKKVGRVHPQLPQGDQGEFQGFSAFLYAARAGSIDAMDALLQAGVDVDSSLPDGTSALLLTVLGNKLDAASFLLDKGADPQLANQGWTALHQLVWTRRQNKGGNQVAPSNRSAISSLQLAEKLIKRGADVNARMTKNANSLYTGRNMLNYVGVTPFMLASHRVDIEYMKLLLAHGADPHITNEDGTNALMVAAGVSLYAAGENPGSAEEVAEAVKILLELGADPNSVDAYGETPLHGAAYRDSGGEAIRLLVGAGGKPDAKNMITAYERAPGQPSLGWTPLMIADGVFKGQVLRVQPKAAETLRELMDARGIPTKYELEGRQAIGQVAQKK